METVHPEDTPPQHVFAIGSIALQWSRVEWLMQKALASLTGKSAALGLIISANLGFRSLEHSLRVLAGVGEHENEEFNRELEGLLDEAARLYAMRNTVVHNTWPDTTDDGNMVALVLRFKGKAKSHEEVWTSDDLMTVYDDTLTLLFAFSAFFVKHGLTDSFDERRQYEKDHGLSAPRVPVALPARSPKSEAVIKQLLPEED